MNREVLMAQLARFIALQRQAEKNVDYWRAHAEAWLAELKRTTP